MKKLNPFFVIGTVGMVFTAMLHIVMALVLNITNVHSVFMALYPAFAAFLTIGTAQMIHTQKPAVVKIKAINKRK